MTSKTRAAQRQGGVGVDEEQETQVERGTPAHMWSMGVEYEQSEDAWARGMGTGLRIAAVTMGYDPKSDGWEMDWDRGRWVRHQ